MASQNHKEVCALLLDAGPTSTRLTRMEQRRCCESEGHMGSARCCSEGPVDQPRGVPPLSRASLNGHKEVCALLLDRGASVDQAAGWNTTVSRVRRVTGALRCCSTWGQRAQDGSGHALPTVASRGSLIDRAASRRPVDPAAEMTNTAYVRVERSHGCLRAAARRGADQAADGEPRSTWRVERSQGGLRAAARPWGQCRPGNADGAVRVRTPQGSASCCSIAGPASTRPTEGHRCTLRVRRPQSGLRAAARSRGVDQAAQDGSLQHEGHKEVCAAAARPSTRHKRMGRRCLSQSKGTDVCALLLDRGATSTRPGRMGGSRLRVKTAQAQPMTRCTPERASQNGHTEVCALLLDRGAKSTSPAMETALDRESERGGLRAAARWRLRGLSPARMECGAPRSERQGGLRAAARRGANVDQAKGHPAVLRGHNGRKESAAALWRAADWDNDRLTLHPMRAQLLVFARAVTVETTAAFRCLLLCLRRSLPGWRASGQICDCAGNRVSPIPSYLMRRIRSFLLPGPEGMAAFAILMAQLD